MKITPLVETRKAMQMYVAPRPISTMKPRRFDCLMRLMTDSPGKAIQFKVAAKVGSRVYVAGSFNHWSASTHPLRYCPEDGFFRATLHLPSGVHQYKFVVNGVWQLDDNCPNWALNTHGTLNSVIQV